MAIEQTKTDITDLLAEYHAIAVAVDSHATKQEDRAYRMAELARLAKSDAGEAQRQLRAINANPTVWDFGDAVAKLRVLRKKSEKVLKQ